MRRGVKQLNGMPFERGPTRTWPDSSGNRSTDGVNDASLINETLQQIPHGSPHGLSHACSVRVLVSRYQGDSGNVPIRGGRSLTLTIKRSLHS